MNQLGAKLVDAAKSARREVVLIAPFVKVQTLSRVLAAISTSATVKVVARWIPAEIAAGVCDLEIFDAVTARNGTELFVHPCLHAKLYRFDEHRLFGSANLTDKALGWSAPSNIELLLDGPSHAVDLAAFEQSILAASKKVDVSYRDQIKSAVDALEGAPSIAALLETELYEVPATWLPCCNAPDKLWAIYSKIGNTRIAQGVIEAAESDLKILGLPPGLSADQFRAQVALVLDGMPVVQLIHHASRDGLTAERATSLLVNFAVNTPLPYDAPMTWEVLQKWLQQFFPGRYREEAVGTIFKQGSIF